MSRWETFLEGVAMLGYIMLVNALIALAVVLCAVEWHLLTGWTP